MFNFSEMMIPDVKWGKERKGKGLFDDTMLSNCYRLKFVRSCTNGVNNLTDINC